MKQLKDQGEKAIIHTHNHFISIDINRTAYMNHEERNWCLLALLCLFLSALEVKGFQILDKSRSKVDEKQASHQ